MSLFLLFYYLTHIPFHVADRDVNEFSSIIYAASAEKAAVEFVDRHLPLTGYMGRYRVTVDGEALDVIVTPTYEVISPGH